MTLGAMTAFGGTQTIWLGWDVAPWEENILQYRVFCGTESGVYTNTVDSYYWDGALIGGVENGSTNYFAVVGIDIDGDQTPMSQELVFIAPPQKIPVLQSVVDRSETTGAPIGMWISSSWELSASWELDYSSDLVNWSIWQTGFGASISNYVSFDVGERYFFRLVLL